MGAEAATASDTAAEPQPAADAINAEAFATPQAAEEQLPPEAPRPETAGKQLAKGLAADGAAAVAPTSTEAAATPAAAVEGGTQQPAATAAVQFVVPDAPDAPAVTPHTAPLLVLEALLSKVAALDPNGFFEPPVSEAVAPGYFTVIKKPMCFKLMRQKLADREYRTWRAFVEDFELICNNATTYNQRRSKIHKAAAQMLRSGKKLLQTSELEGRKAVALLHPDGPHAAALEEEREATAAGSAMAGATPSTVKLEPSAAPEGAGSKHAPSSALTAYEALFEDSGASSGGEDYSSFSDTDLEEDGGGGQLSTSSSAAAAAQQQDPLLHQNLSAVEWQPWPRANAKNVGGAGNNFNETELVLVSGRSAMWKAARRGLEWRHHWLQLRTTEAAFQAERCEALVQRFAGDPHAQENPEGAVTSAVPAGDGRQPHRRRARSGPNFAGLADGLRDHPFFAHHMFGELPAKWAERCGAKVTEVDGVGGPGEATGSQMYAAFQVLSHRLQQLRGVLSQQGARGAERKLPRTGSASRLPPARSRSQSSMHPGSPQYTARFKGSAPSALRIPSKSETSGASGSKRRRSEQDTTYYGGGDPQQKVTLSVEISVPPVREIDEREWSRREAVLDAMRQLHSSVGMHSLGGGGIMGNGASSGGGGGSMEALLAEAVGADGGLEGSSSEDTDDESYLRRHHVMEIQERERFNTAGTTGGGGQRSQQQQQQLQQRPLTALAQQFGDPCGKANLKTPSAPAAAVPPLSSP